MPAERTIDAAPTKDFFIHMLVRDIELIPAVGDLVDNCIDGARRMRETGPYDGLFVRISLDPDRFTIEDNCGGIPLDVAEKYAFRFGRPEGMVRLSHSIGQFGVGMKRALFKLGNRFSIASSTETDSFVVDVDVPEWQDSEDWQFEFEDYETDQENVETGTTIRVTELHEEVQANFIQSSFLTRLAKTLGAHHNTSTSQGLVITVNGVPVGGPALQLLKSDRLEPASQTMVLHEESPSPVSIRIFVGLDEASSPPDAGWYVYCNGRLVLAADKSASTGWGVGEESRFPQFHNRYGRFRGYVFFDSDDSSKLPWTTTKTGLNSESGVYQRALQAMRLVGRPVAQFLYDLSIEVEYPPDHEGTELEAIVQHAHPVDLSELDGQSRFTYERPARRRRPPIQVQSIQYKRPTTEIDEAKTILGVDSASEVGQRTFEYFLKREGGS